MDKPLILFKVVKELNIGIATAVDILIKGGFEIENKPTSKITSFQLQYLRFKLGLDPLHQEKKEIVPEDNEITSFALLSKRRINNGIPESVFKYFSPNEYSLKGLEHGYLYHNHFANFNDPFDCNINLIDFNVGTKEYLGTMSEFQDRLNRIGICCFAGTNDSTLMWSHYADNHSGFCLEFKTNKSPRGINPLNVVYKNGFIQASYHKHKEDAITHLLYSKSICWKYEGELRSIITNVKSESNRCVAYDRDELLSVYLGSRCRQEITERIKDIIKHYHVGVKLYKAKLSQNSFEMKWEKELY
jgi:hypothetical protein